ncbi:MAG: CoA transferase [Alphaproteobacteria bacterium]|nr:CoA transferase [Alphaproteobacteria bacterium]
MADESQSAGALAGIRVIDLTRVLGGPYCTQMLADHGADVIKVEPPGGDEVRDWGPPFRDGTASYYVGVNRNKRTMSLDLTVPKGREVLLRLLETADALIENQKVGTMERWGLGYETNLKARFPRLVYCHVTGFGATGPWGGLPGYDAAVQAVSGLISINGSRESGPVRMGTPMVDMGTGLYAANAILMALLERQRSGKGQFLDVALFDCAIALVHPHAANYFMSGKAPELIGNSHPNISPYDLYQTQGRPIFLAVGNNRQFLRLCQALGKPELTRDARFLTNQDRVVNRAALNDELGRLLAKRDGAALADQLLADGVPCGAMLSLPEVFAHPHTQHRNMVLNDGAYRGTGIPVKLSRTPGRMRWAPKPFGADGREVLSEAGMSAAEIDDLVAQGVLVEQRRRSG